MTRPWYELCCEDCDHYAGHGEPCDEGVADHGPGHTCPKHTQAGPESAEDKP